jgi:hypothetical protein
VLQWFKSSYSSGNGQCVECARTPDGGMAVRDSKDPDGPKLVTSPADWRAFTASVKARQYNLP